MEGKKRSLRQFWLATLVLVFVPLICFGGGAKEAEPEEKSLYGGRLGVGFGAGEGLEHLRCDESWQYTDMGCIYWPLVYDQLWIVGPPPDYEALPMLASSWDVSEDRKTWTFHLRENATFHDGVPVTAEDVAFVIEDLTATPVWHMVDTIYETLTVIDDYTIQVTMKRPHVYPPFYWVPIIPKHLFEPYKEDIGSYPNEKSIGSGQFKLKEFKPGEYIWLEANQDYWAGRPYLDEITFKVYGNEDLMYMALKSGDIDMIGYNGCSVVAVDGFKKAENIEIIVSPGIRMTFLAFNLHKNNSIKDLNVRKAIMHGIDTNRITDMVYLGYAQNIDSIVYSDLPDHNPNLSQYDHNPDKADRILNEAGYRDTDGDGLKNDPDTGKNLTFDLVVAESWVPEIKISRLIKENLEGIGIGIKIKIVDEGTYYDFIYNPQGDTHDISFGDIEPGPNANWVWALFLDPEGEGAGWNTAYYHNPEFDRLTDKMLTEPDLEKRRQYVREMQKILNEDLPYGFLLKADVMDPVRVDKFEGYVPMGGISNWINSWTYFKVHKK